jgi:hypothetical protein
VDRARSKRERGRKNATNNIGKKKGERIKLPGNRTLI